MRLARRVFPVETARDSERFLIRRADGRRAATPLLLALLAVETTDVVFAFDSIPAIFGVTRDPFLVFASNVFAILGLRSLYFAVARLVARFAKLKVWLCVLLISIGAKMVVGEWLDWHPPTAWTLGLVVACVGGGILHSLRGGRSGNPGGTT